MNRAFRVLLSTILLACAAMLMISACGSLTNPLARTTKGSASGVQTNKTGPAQVILRPFSSTGSAAAGWSIAPDQGSVSEVDCSYPEPSPASKSPGIQSCSPSAASADSCYFAHGSTTGLCLQNPFGRSLAQVITSGSITYDIVPPATPTPLGIVLDDNTECRLRNGGAWSAQDQNPTYVGYYGCETTPGSDSSLAVWADPANSRDGITRSATGWSVQVGDAHSSLTTHTIKTAYFVGTAG